MAGYQEWCETWAIEALRVLKPGGHMLVFGGTRTYHRMVCAIEDAGFEIRDTIEWIYATGFPKSLDVSKAIDKAARGFPQGAEDPTSPNHGRFKGGVSEENPTGRGFGAGPGNFMRQQPPWFYLEETPEALAARAKYEAGGGAERKVVGRRTDRAATPKEDIRGGRLIGGTNGAYDGSAITAPATEAARQWDGWGTALKPAHEPIVLARKPLAAGNVVANVLTYGTGALSIDGCRIGYQSPGDRDSATPQGRATSKNSGAIGAEPDAGREMSRVEFERSELRGRWPANLILAHSEECRQVGSGRVPTSVNHHQSPTSIGGNGIYQGAAARVGHDYADAEGMETVELWDCVEGCPVRQLDEQSGVSQSRVGQPRAGLAGNGWGLTHTGAEYDDAGGASRFFFVAKPSTTERNEGLAGLPAKQSNPNFGTGGFSRPTDQPDREQRAQPNHHPTVKPVTLMRYLIRLITPPGGVVLDMFQGSGTTGVAAMREEVRYIGIESFPEYAPIAEARIRHAHKRVLAAGKQLTLGL